MVINMDLRQYEYFIAIAEEGNLSKAAQRVYVSQPTLSNFLSKLECDENVLFFNRKSIPFTLTEAGKLFYESSKQILQIQSECDRQLCNLRNLQNNQLIFGVHADRGVKLLTQLMSMLSSQYPDMHIELKKANALDLANLVVNGDIDLAFSAYAEKKAQLEYIDYPPLEVAVVINPAHPLAHLGTTNSHDPLPHLSLTEFCSERFCLLSRGSILGELVSNYCQQNNIELNVAAYVHDISSAFSMVTDNQLLSLCPVNLLPFLRSEYRYVGLKPCLFYHTAAYYSKTAHQSKLMLDFICKLQQTAASEYL